MVLSMSRQIPSIVTPPSLSTTERNVLNHSMFSLASREEVLSVSRDWLPPSSRIATESVVRRIFLKVIFYKR